VKLQGVEHVEGSQRQLAVAIVTFLNIDILFLKMFFFKEKKETVMIL